MAALLMLALYRVGRQTEAFDVFFKVKRYVADATGQDVGRDLAHLYRQMIDNDAGLHTDGPKERPRPEPEETPKEGPKEGPKAAKAAPTVHNEFGERVDARGATFGIVNNYGAPER